ncbi:MAG: type IV pilus twitching motility protein PilT [Actinobacteria bacterium]|nr:type IV pilus twitching motility protein PilT [Actinomycetota bacterium]
MDVLLTDLVQKTGSDLHLKVGEPPVVRIHGRLIRENLPPLTDENMQALLSKVLSEGQWRAMDKELELDLAYSVAGLARFRVNAFHQSGHLGAVFRVIPFKISTVDDLGLPPVVKEFCDLPRGIVLVTGPTGSGKSTSLAAMIDYINTSRTSHIMTIEDPIEFLHMDKRSTINQRELGADTRSFAEALKHVMRQAPDIILVGELRDLETISLAVTAAETGHLVFATLHTTDAAQTIDRMIDVFPPNQQSQIRMQLGMTLQAVVSQTLLPKKEGNGRVAAFEVLVCHAGVRNLIREGKTHQIYSLIQTGGEMGMRLLDDSLSFLVIQDIVEFDEAIAKSSNPNEFSALVGRRRQTTAFSIKGQLT